MAQERLHLLVRRLRGLADPGRAGDGSDAHLLQRFVTTGDTSAFELLVWRHGGMVLSLCRRLLRHYQDAEDAFQATFLTLVRKAGSIRQRDALASWLYRVAYRIALAARERRQAQAAREEPWDDLPAPVTPDELAWRDLRPVLDEEVNGLPEKFRLPFILCHLEGKTNEEAAELLGCPKGTVLSRLSRARERLRERLSRRGVTLTAGVMALAAREAQATPTVALVEATVHAAQAVAAGTVAASVVSSRAAALTEGVVRDMFLKKVKTAVAAALVLGLVGLGAGALTQAGDPPPTEEQRPRPPQARERPPARAAAPAAAPEDEARLREARRLVSERNLRQIALAMHSYHDTYGHFPPPAIYGKDGKPLLSWRVLLLPWLEQDNLYKQFKLDEPWDSPHNKALMEAHRPKVYGLFQRSPDGPPLTWYQVFVGKGTMFERPVARGVPGGGAAGVGMPGGGMGGAVGPMGGSTPGMPGAAVPGAAPPMGGMGMGAGGMPAAGGMMGPGMAAGMGSPDGGQSGGGVRMAEVVDGTSNTMLVVEGGTAVPWTKPEDLPYGEDERLPKLGGLFEGDFNAAFADGSARFLSRQADPALLRAAIVRNDGQVLNFRKLEVPPALRHASLATIDMGKVRRENEALHDQVRAARVAIQEARQQLDRLRAEVEEERAVEAKKAALLAEQADLRDALEQSRKDLELLREETEKLRKELEEMRRRRR